MSTTTPREERAHAREQRGLARDAASIVAQPHKSAHAREHGRDTRGAAPQTPTEPFNFLGLPRELRDMVYNQPWKSKNRVAAYHAPTRAGILAYYNGTVLDEIDLTTKSAIRGSFEERDERENWRPNVAAGLPQWLLTSKQTLEEGLEHFRLEAHWNVWSVVPYHAGT